MDPEELAAQVPRPDDRAARALGVAGQWLGDGVEGVAIGETPDGDPCLVVYVSSTETPSVRALPDECEGLPVRVETGGTFTAETDPAPPVD